MFTSILISIAILIVYVVLSYFVGNFVYSRDTTHMYKKDKREEKIAATVIGCCILFVIIIVSAITYDIISNLIIN